MVASGELSALLKREGLIRTELDCHNCTSKGITPNRFIATINYDLNGNHKIECPRCGHHHYRVVKDGVVTGERYDSDHRTIDVPRGTLWKSETVPIIASTASSFLRDLWLNPNR